MESIVLAEDLFWPMAVKDNKLFAVVTRRGILASYDMGEEKWGHLCLLPEGYIVWEGLFLHLLQDGDKLYFFSETKSRIFIYDIAALTSGEVSVFSERGEGRQYYKASSVIDHGDYILILPVFNREIISFHKRTREIRKYSDWEQDFRVDFEGPDFRFEFMKRDSACIIKDHFYALARCGERDVIFSFSLENMKLQSICGIDGAGRLFGMEAEGDCIWLQNRTDEGSCLICWNTETGTVEKKSEIFPDIHKRVLKIKNMQGTLLASFTDGHMVAIDGKSLIKKEQMEDSFFYAVQGNHKALIRIGASIYLADVKNESIQEIAFPAESYLNTFIAFIKGGICARNTGGRSDYGGGKTIFQFLCGENSGRKHESI